MTDLQKDLAIYNEMLRIANEVFNNATEESAFLRKVMSENSGTVSLNDILKRGSDAYNAILLATLNEYETGGKYDITVDTFTCSFPAMRVFDLLKYWKSLAKVKGDILFTYEEEINRELVGSVDITFENPANAKLLANSLGDDILRPSMNNILLEVNATSGDISFVACGGCELAVITSNPASLSSPVSCANSATTYQALFTKTDWKRICDYATKQKTSVTFEIYKRGEIFCEYSGKSETEHYETMVAILGNVRVRSSAEQMYFPKWKTVLPEITAMHHAAILQEDVPHAQRWLSKVKAHSVYDSVAVSVYQGSDIIYFDTENGTDTSRLSRPSSCTVGTRLSIRRLQKKKFSGFYIPEDGSGTVISDACTDFMLMMPVEGDSPIRDCNIREVLAETTPEACEPAMTAALQAA